MNLGTCESKMKSGTVREYRNSSESEAIFLPQVYEILEIFNIFMNVLYLNC